MNAVESHLLAISRIPANSGHSLHKGTPREAFIREFLEAHLNTTVSVGTGEIIDAKSKPSEKRNQFDIVIYKRNYPRLDFGGGINGFLVESVVATIEVKSILDKIGLEQAIRAARNAKSLTGNDSSSMRVGYAPPKPLSLVVAYDGPARMETIHDWIKDIHHTKGITQPEMPLNVDRTQIASPTIEGIYVLGKGFISFDNAPLGIIPAELRAAYPQGRWAIANTEIGNLLSLFLLLTMATSSLHASVLNPLPYLENFRVSDLQFGD